MKRSLITLAFLLALLSVSVQAQGASPPAVSAPTLSEVTVSLWPEYDRPEMLVMMAGQLAAGTAFPLTVEIRIPASAGKPSALAYVGSGDQLLTQPYTTRAEGDQLLVSFDLSTSGFQLEYYAPLAQEGNQRTYTYSYVADYPTTLFYFSAQVPRTAQQFVLNPPADSVSPQSDGLTYHQSQVGPLAPGDSKSWTVSYQKADAALTEGSAQPAATTTVTPVAGGGSSTALIFFIAFVALVGVAAGAFWLGRRAQPSSPAAGLGQDKSAPRLGPTHCYACRTPLRPDADFCHKCGAKVRKL